MGKACADTHLQFNYIVTLWVSRYRLNSQTQVEGQNSNAEGMEQMR